MPNKLFISDERMLKLMDYTINQARTIENEKKFLELIGFQQQNIANVRTGIQGFTKNHIQRAAMATGVNINWLFGIEQTMMRGNDRPAEELLREAVVAVEARAQELERVIELMIPSKKPPVKGASKSKAKPSNGKLNSRQRKG